MGMELIASLVAVSVTTALLSYELLSASRATRTRRTRAIKNLRSEQWKKTGQFWAGR